MIKSDYSFISKGVKLTEELSVFLKVQVETREDTLKNIASYYGIKADKLSRNYKKVSSGYGDWDQWDHADRYLVYPKNIGPYLSIDEVALSRGELYTVLSNKAGRSKRGTLVALIKGTRCEDIIKVLNKLPHKDKVKEVTLDMAQQWSWPSAVSLQRPVLSVIDSMW